MNQAAAVRVAALYVSERGPYVSMPGVDAWDEARDARRYSGPWPVVAHPPCAPWGRLRSTRRVLCAKWGTDPDKYTDCGPRAVEQVRTFGGVLEHPQASALWAYCGLPRPGMLPDVFGGVTAEVWQGAYGHPCPKPTWIYLVGVRAGLDCRSRHDPGGRVVWQHSRHRDLTPEPFARLLVELAASADVGTLPREAPR